MNYAKTLGSHNNQTNKTGQPNEPKHIVTVAPDTNTPHEIGTPTHEDTSETHPRVREEAETIFNESVDVADIDRNYFEQEMRNNQRRGTNGGRDPCNPLSHKDKDSKGAKPPEYESSSTKHSGSPNNSKSRGRSITRRERSRSPSKHRKRSISRSKSRHESYDKKHRRYE